MKGVHIKASRVERERARGKKRREQRKRPPAQSCTVLSQHTADGERFMVDCHYGWWLMLYGSLIVCGWTWAQFVFCLLVTLYQWLRMRKSPINRAMLSAGPLLVTHGNLHPCAVLRDWLE